MEILPSIIVMDDAVNDRLCHSRITLSPNSAIPVSWFKLSAEDDSEGHKLGIASNHGDVLHWFPKHGKSMDTFRDEVKALLNTTASTDPAPNKEPLIRAGDIVKAENFLAGKEE